MCFLNKQKKNAPNFSCKTVVNKKWIWSWQNQYSSRNSFLEKILTKLAEWQNVKGFYEGSSYGGKKLAEIMHVNKYL